MTVLIVLCCASLTLEAQELYPLEAISLSRDEASDLERLSPNINSLPTNANFEGGVSINGSNFKSGGKFISEGHMGSYDFILTPSESVNILFRFLPDLIHIGQEVDIALTVGYLDISTLVTFELMGISPLNLGKEMIFFMLDSENRLLVLPEHWGGSDLVPFKRVTLQPSQDFVLYQGQLSEGFIMINCYYRLQDGTLVFNKMLISIKIYPSDFIYPLGFLG